MNLRIANKKGLAPGHVVYVGKNRSATVQTELIEFDEVNYSLSSGVGGRELKRSVAQGKTGWLNVSGVHDEGKLVALGEELAISPLCLEDIANTHHRPKYEDMGNDIFLSFKMVSNSSSKSRKLKIEQVSLIIREKSVVTFQEEDGDVWNPLRKRIENSAPRQRFVSSDYLAYALIDSVVDEYFSVLENLGDELDDIESQLIADALQVNTQSLYDLRRTMITLKKAIWPMREVAGSLLRSESGLLNEKHNPYFRDLYEHVIQVIDTVETFREMANGLLDLYLSSMSNRTNEVMRVLTIIATIFIPLGFLAGVYGMNFDTSASEFNMPELGFRFGYPLFWVITLSVALGLVLMFKRKKWL